MSDQNQNQNQNQNPTVVLVHGAFAESASWNGVIERLKAKSIDVIAAGNPLRGVANDAAYVRDVIAGTGKPVVVVGHSYGGFVVTEAAANNDAVLGVVYVAGFAPDHGESANELAAKFPGSTLVDALTAYPISTGGVELAIRQDVFHEQFAADVPAAQAELMGVTQRPASEAIGSDTLQTDEPAWKSNPSWFVIPEKDLNIPAAVQRFMAERANSRTTEVAGASHAVMVSNPDVVTDAILDAVAAVASR